MHYLKVFDVLSKKAECISEIPSSLIDLQNDPNTNTISCKSFDSDFWRQCVQLKLHRIPKISRWDNIYNMLASE